MKERADFYGLGEEFTEAREKLIESDKPSVESGGSARDEEKIAETLRKAETAIKDLDHEEGAIVGLDGRLVKTVKGEKTHIKPPVELLKDNIFTHNHPNNACAPSANDVINIIKYDGYGVRAVTRDGRFVYLRKGGGELNTELGIDMLKNRLDNGSIKIRADAQARQKYGPKATREKIIREMENIINTWLIDNAHKYGYIFTQGKI
jgi:hypothetical protein